MYNQHPKVVRDIFWDKGEPYLPYTKSSLNTKLSNLHPHSGSTIDLNIGKFIFKLNKNQI